MLHIVLFIINTDLAKSLARPKLGKAGQDWVMVRKLGVEYPGAIYHVMNRGDRREAIFRDNRAWVAFK